MALKLSANEFDARIDKEGKISVPDDLRRTLFGKLLHVRVYTETIADSLQSKNVGEEEIDAIADMQLETRAQVVKFLMAEGSLTNNKAFRRRARLAT